MATLNAAQLAKIRKSIIESMDKNGVSRDGIDKTLANAAIQNVEDEMVANAVSMREWATGAGLTNAQQAEIALATIIDYANRQGVG